MNEPPHEDPVADSGARAAQLAAMLATVVEGLARLQAQRLADRAAVADRHRRGLLVQRRLAQATARLAPPPRPDPGRPQPTAKSPAPKQARPKVTIVCTARDLADQAYPVPLRAAMATARQAAATAGALPAPPVRRSLTSDRHR